MTLRIDPSHPTAPAQSVCQKRDETPKEEEKSTDPTGADVKSDSNGMNAFVEAVTRTTSAIQTRQNEKRPNPSASHSERAPQRVTENSSAVKSDEKEKNTPSILQPKKRKRYPAGSK